MLFGKATTTLSLLGLKPPTVLPTSNSSTALLNRPAILQLVGHTRPDLLQHQL